MQENWCELCEQKLLIEHSTICVIPEYKIILKL